MSTMPDAFAVAATRPIWRRVRPRCSINLVFHCSTSGVRSTRINVGTRCSAINAHAITVLPDPVGATSSA